MEYKVTDDNIKIFDSYKISQYNFRKELEAIKELYPNHCIWNRSMGSLRREWATHNFLYSIGYKQSRTKDVDLNYPQKWYVRLGYFIVGNFSLLLIY